MTITLGTIQPAAAATTPTAKDAAQHAKLVDAAQQFEGMMLQELLKSMQKGAEGEDGDDSTGGGADTLRSFGTESVAHGIAKGGGFGIAKQVVDKVTREQVHGAQR